MPSTPETLVNIFQGVFVFAAGPHRGDGISYTYRGVGPLLMAGKATRSLVYLDV